MNARLASLTPPGENRNLGLFRDGLARAADYTTLIAEGPPPGGRRESANAVAELTLAAGQVQAGALGYQAWPTLLGDWPGCRRLGPQRRHPLTRRCRDCNFLS